MKHENIIRSTIFAAAAMAAMAAAAEPTVTDVVAKQRYPWNGLVDITCRVTGISGTTDGLKFAVAAVMPDSGDVNKVSSFWVMQNGSKLSSRKVRTNGDYQLLWDAKADLGQVNYDNMVVRVTCVEAKVQLWEGGPYWAETNIGAEIPEDYGYYFWWGDTVGYKRENGKWVASDGSSSNFSFDSVRGISITTRASWVTADDVLVPEHDAAHVHWGGNWRMPTEQELSNLSSKCTWTVTLQHGVTGYEVRGKGDYASASIFLPIAGYWSCVRESSNYVSDYAWCLRIYWDSHYGYSRKMGLYFYVSEGPIRPVQSLCW